MKAFYKKLIEKLTSAAAVQTYKDAGLNPVRLVDFYRQQYLEQQSFDVLVLPAVLLQYSIVYPNEPNKNGEALITLHLCYEQLRDTSNVSKSIDKALEYLDFVDCTFGLIKNLESDYTGKLKLIGDNNNKDDAIINVHLLNFQASYSGKMVSNVEKWDYTEEDTVNIEDDTKLVEKEYDFS